MDIKDLGKLVPQKDATGLITASRSFADSLASLARPSFDISPAIMQIRPIAVQESETFQEGIQEVIEEMQAGLAADEELFVYYANSLETIRVGHVYMSSTNVAVISGLDAEGNQARVVAHFKSLQFVCKVMKVPDDRPKLKIGFTIS